MTGGATQPLSPQVRQYLSRFVWRRRIAQLARRLTVAVVASVVWLLGWAMVDRIVDLPAAVRLLLLVLLIVMILSILIQPLWRILRRGADLHRAAAEVERATPAFGEMLRTVVSLRRQGASEASAEMLALLDQRVESLVRQESVDVDRLAPWRIHPREGFTLLLCAMALLAAWNWSWLGLAQLLARQAIPLAGVPPVTTTRIHAATGSDTVVQGRPFTVLAFVSPPPPAGVLLRMSSDGQTWTSLGMTPAPDGSFRTRLSSIARDFTYEIAAGDAVSERHSVRVLRRPLVRELRVRLVYPPYIGRESLVFASADGHIEAPAGTRATVAVVASEPLRDASISIEGRRLASTPTPDPHVRRIEIPIDRDATYQIDMLSEHGTSGSGPGEMTIRAIPDRPPVARLVTSAPVTHLGARDSTAIVYEAADDYGLGRVEIRVEINGVEREPIPRDAPNGLPQLRDRVSVDLQRWNLQIGDLVSLTLAAADRAGQEGLSAPVRIVVASNSITAAERGGIAELREASRLAAATRMHLESAAAVLAESGDEARMVGRAASRIGAASETASLLLRSLLRAAAGPNESKPTIGRLVDASQVLSARLRELHIQAESISADQTRERLTSLHSDTSGLQPQILTVWRGLHADMVRKQLDNLDAIQKTQPPNERTLSLVREELQSSLAELGIDSRSPRVRQMLQGYQRELQDLVASMPPVDFVEAAKRWSATETPSAEMLPERLNAAAQVHAAGQAPDLHRAADLHLASRAARTIDALMSPGTRTGLDTRQAYTAALAAILREHEWSLSHRDGADSEAQSISAAAARARRSMREWAGEPDVARVSDAQDLLPSEPGVGDATLDRNEPLANREIEDANREPALQAIRRAQELLAELPQHIARSEEGAAWSRQTRQRADQAEHDASRLPADQRGAARRAALAARRQADEAFEALTEMSRAIHPDVALMAARELSQFAPATSAAVDPIERELVPSLAALRDAIHASDPEGAERAAGDARRSIAVVQDALRDARQTLVEQDPLVAARRFARQTAVPATQDNDPPSGVQSPDRGFPQSPLFSIEPSRLRPWRPSDIDLARREADPPGYQDALRVYFDALNQAKPQETP